MAQSLDGKVALITGGGVRVGRAIGQALAGAGAALAVHFNRSSRGAEDLVAAIRAAGGRADAFGADLTDPGQIEPLVERAEKNLGPLNVLVNSAARFDRAPFLGTPLSTLEDQWALNARAPFLLTQAVARRMAIRGGGDIVNVLDVGGALRPWRQYSAYGMTKAAMASLTQCLALELAPAIRVNGVAPGAVLPPEGMTPEELARLKEAIPQRRLGSAEEVAQAVLFLLAGPRYITGQILAVDGGQVLGRAAGPT